MDTAASGIPPEDVDAKFWRRRGFDELRGGDVVLRTGALAVVVFF